MAIPGFSSFLRPVLELVAKNKRVDGARRSLSPLIKEKMKFSDAEANERLSSGGKRLENRVGWALTYLTKAGLISFPNRGIAEITDLGLQFLKTHTGPIAVKDLDRFEPFKEFRSNKAKALGVDEPDQISNEELDPEDRIDSAIREIWAAVAEDLLERLGQVDPSYFEQVILDLLGKMGYGVNEGKLVRTGGPGDGGIDGIVHLDRLGLDKIYLQAKRWKKENVVRRPEIQAFFGSLAGRKATKGVFITTSKFTQDAIDFAKSVSDTLVLIDGKQLSQLMIEYEVGISSKKRISIPEIDQDYFE